MSIAASEMPVSAHIWKAALGLRVLVVEDVPVLRDTCVEIVRHVGFDVEGVTTLEQAHSYLKTHRVDIVLLDIYVGEGYSLAILNHFRRLQPNAAIVIMTSYMSADLTSDLLRHGVAGYLEKPFTIRDLKLELERAAAAPAFRREMQWLREAIANNGSAHLIAARSVGMQKVVQMVSRVALNEHPVLIVGEQGTGKEYVARCIHAKGKHAAEPFVLWDCTTTVREGIPIEVREAEFQECLSWLDQPCTMYFDEIGILPLELQDALFLRLHGGSRAEETAVRPIRAKIVAASSRDLAVMVEAGLFRRQLHQRINLTKITIPSLRHRQDDIPLIVCSVLEGVRHELGSEYALADDVMAFIVRHEWKGNIRELEETLRQACLSCSGFRLNVCDLISAHPEWPREPPPKYIAPDEQIRGGPQQVSALAELEKEALLAALKHLNGDRLLAAQRLGIGKTTLYRKLKEYGISADKEHVSHSDCGMSPAA